MSADPSSETQTVDRPFGLVIMGVSGSGKSTVGVLLARRLGWPFFDGDDYHPPANVSKMAAGQPLTDADRWPWLETLRALIASRLAGGESLVLACSALKAAYRDLLRVDDRVFFVYLKGSFELLAQRTSTRTGHFMPAALLASQFAALEEPEGALVVDVALSPPDIVERIVSTLRQTGQQSLPASR